MDKINEKITSQLEKIKNEYTEDFIESLVKIKVTLIVIFIAITVIYLMQEDEFIKSGNVGVYTMLHLSEYLKKLICVASLDGLFGASSFVFILGSRGGWSHIGKNVVRYFKEIILTAIILFLFRFSQESSGFNRWMDPNAKVYKELDKMEMNRLEQLLEQDALNSINGEHKVLNDKQKSEIIQEVQLTYKKGLKVVNKIPEYAFMSPFGYAVEKTAMSVTGLFMAYYSVKMLIAAFYGYSSNANGLFENNISGGKFTTELVIMFIFNTIPSMVAPYIYEEKYKASDILMALGMGGISVVIHTLFQYAGLYQGLGK